MQLLDDAGDLVERYAYDRYGNRTVYQPVDGTDAWCLAPGKYSARVQVSGQSQPYGLCEVGFQGLWHDEAIGTVDNRARVYLPPLGRFAQTDPLGYPDGLNRYAAYHVMRGGVDPSGRNNGYKMESDQEAAMRKHREQTEGSSYYYGTGDPTGPTGLPSAKSPRPKPPFCEPGDTRYVTIVIWTTWEMRVPLRDGTKCCMTCSGQIKVEQEQICVEGGRLRKNYWMPTGDTVIKEESKHIAIGRKCDLKLHKCEK